MCFTNVQVCDVDKSHVSTVFCKACGFKFCDKCSSVVHSLWLDDMSEHQLQPFRWIDWSDNRYESTHRCTEAVKRERKGGCVPVCACLGRAKGVDEEGEGRGGRENER